MTGGTPLEADRRRFGKLALAVICEQRFNIASQAGSRKAPLCAQGAEPPFAFLTRTYQIRVHGRRNSVLVT
jgi:hypothetical protein